MLLLVYFVVGFFSAGYLVKTGEKDSVFSALVVACLWPIIVLLGLGTWARKKVDAL